MIKDSIKCLHFQELIAFSSPPLHHETFHRIIVERVVGLCKFTGQPANIALLTFSLPHPPLTQHLGLLEHQLSGAGLLVRRIAVFPEDALYDYPHPGPDVFPEDPDVIEVFW